MKIALVIDDSLDRPDGVQQYMTTLGDYFTSVGHEVHYLTTQTVSRTRPNVHNLGKSLKARFNGNSLTMPLPIKRSKAKRLLANEQFDVVHVQLPYSPLFSGKLLSMLPKSTAVVGTFHILPYGLASRVGTRLLRLSSWKSLRRFDRIFSVSSPAQNFARRSYGISSEVLPNAVDLSSYKADNFNSEFRVLFLGRLVERKGVKQFLRIMAEVSKKEPSVLIDIAGDGPEREHLERLVDRYDLADQTAFHGFVDEDKKRELLTQSMLAVFPSLGGESFGIVLAEAMASHTAVVLAGDNPGYRSVMKDNEDQLIDPHDIQAAAGTILDFLNSPDKRKRALAWQSKLIKEYDIVTIGPKLLKHYEEILKSKKRMYNTDNA